MQPKTAKTATHSLAVDDAAQRSRHEAPTALQRVSGRIARPAPTLTGLLSSMPKATRRAPQHTRYARRTAITCIRYGNAAHAPGGTPRMRRQTWEKYDGLEKPARCASSAMLMPGSACAQARA